MSDGNVDPKGDVNSLDITRPLDIYKQQSARAQEEADRKLDDFLDRLINDPASLHKEIFESDDQDTTNEEECSE